MGYIGCRFELFLFVADDSRQIFDTFDYYRNVRGKDVGSPSESDFFGIDGLRIECVFPWSCNAQFLDVKVGDISFHINANAFAYVQEMAKHYEELRRGSLYKFSQGLLTGSPFGPVGMYFLPGSVMRGLNEHDWSQHDEQIRQWLSVREGILEDMLDKGLLERRIENPVPVGRNPDYSKN